MQFILSWENDAAQYQAEFQGTEIKKPERCPQCGCGKFHKWGKYERYIIEEDSIHRISVRRIRCVKCLGTYSYLPSFCLSGTSYGLNFVMKILEALLMKIKISLEERRRRAYTFLRRFIQSENLWLIFLRARGFGSFPTNKRARLAKIFAALLEFHQKGELPASFLRETVRHFLSAK